MAFPIDFSPESRVLDTKRYVYHYTTRDIALQYLLSTRKIRLGPLSKTNDPRETKSWVFGLPSDSPNFLGSAIEPIKDIERINSIFQSASTMIRANCKVLCSSLDDPTYNSTFSTLEFHEFKRGFGRSRMWAQYGERHKGVCLIFDRARLHEAVLEELKPRCDIYNYPVTYSDKIDANHILSEALNGENITRQGLEQSLASLRKEHLLTYFFTKSMDWSREFEYRWIAIGENDETEFVPIDEAIAGVVVGVDFPKDHLLRLIPLCKGLGIPAARISWENGIPLLRERFV